MFATRNAPYLADAVIQEIAQTTKRVLEEPAANNPAPTVRRQHLSSPGNLWLLGLPPLNQLDF
jgi:hypothetical protein